MSAHTLGTAKREFDQFRPTSLEQGGLQSVRINRYDNGVIQADSYIRRIFASLAELGYLDNSLVFVTSDHSENLGEDGNLPDHGWNLRQLQIGIPLLIFDTSQTQYLDLRVTRQIDIAPTIVDRLNMDIPRVWWGRSLLRKSEDKCSYHQSVTGNRSYAVVCQLKETAYKYSVSDTKLFGKSKEKFTYDPVTLRDKNWQLFQIRISPLI
jgi:arylsulfatase A-like enzyme